MNIEEIGREVANIYHQQRGHEKSFDRMIESKDSVISRFGEMFLPKRVDELDAEDFKSFLTFENNTHWTGLHRQGNKICADMNALRRALRILADETRPIERRLDEGIALINGMGKAIATAVLLIMFPDRYGVWNSTSEAALKSMDAWPRFERGSSIGQRYVQINEILTSIAREAKLDLWTLDAVWWSILAKRDYISDDQVEPTHEALTETSPQLQTAFGLERHLHEFLRDNWDHTDLARDGWSIYSEPGDDQYGYEYPCGVGFIDILARHKNGNQWLIIELKRAQTSDSTVGQVLRYMGWIQQHLADDNDEVRGLIISQSGDEKLTYALRLIPSVDLLLYEVDFRLVQSKS